MPESPRVGAGATGIGGHSFESGAPGWRGTPAGGVPRAPSPVEVVAPTGDAAAAEVAGTAAGGAATAAASGAALTATSAPAVALTASTFACATETPSASSSFSIALHRAVRHSNFREKKAIYILKINSCG